MRQEAEEPGAGFSGQGKGRVSATPQGESARGS